MQRIFTHQVEALFATTTLDLQISVSAGCLYLSVPAEQKDDLVDLLDTGILHAVRLLDDSLMEFAINGDRPQQIEFWLEFAAPSAQVECLMQHIALAKTLLEEARSNGKSTFQVDLDGRYIQAHLSKTADPPCSDAAMIGRTIHAVIGTEGGAILLAGIRDAIASGKQREVAYPGLINGERRWYLASVYPRQTFAQLIVTRAYFLEGSAFAP